MRSTHGAAAMSFAMHAQPKQTNPALGQPPIVKCLALRGAKAHGIPCVCSAGSASASASVAASAAAPAASAARSPRQRKGTNARRYATCASAAASSTPACRSGSRCGARGMGLRMLRAAQVTRVQAPWYGKVVCYGSWLPH